MPDRRNEFEILVVGAGPAGMAAACAAAEAGCRVAVLDNSPWRGGQIWRGEQTQPVQAAARRWMERLKRSGAHVIQNATVFAAPAPHCVQQVARGRRTRVWKSFGRS
jgi:D-hydroxyproline dehydrogenase subunit alpha